MTTGTNPSGGRKNEIRTEDTGFLCGAENKLNTEHVSGEISKEKWTGGLEAVAHTEK
jgi:hypothetical protein